MRHIGPSSFSSALLQSILFGVGIASAVSSAACSDDTSGAGSGGAGGATSSTSTSKSSTASGHTASTSTASQSASNTSAASTAASTGSGMTNVERCFPTPVAGCPTSADAMATFGACTSDGESITDWISGPTTVGDTCCYQVDVTDPNDPACGAIGRPFVVDAVQRSAHILRGRRGWSPRATQAPARARRARSRHLDPDVAGLDEATRLRLGADWAGDGAYEHASIASFGKLALELLAFGAPADLIRDTHAAALDEVHHAELTLGLAASYLGVSLAPASLPEARSVSGATTLAELAVAAVREGCFGETVAAVVASKQRDAAEDAAVRSVLRIVADDEARHAELAFRVVAWAIVEGGADVSAAVRDAFNDSLSQARGEVASAARGDHSDLRRHGRLDDAELAHERRMAIESVVVPAMTSLLDG